MSLNDEPVALQTVFGDVVLVELVKPSAPIRQDLALGDVGDAALLVLQLAAVDHNGICLGDIAHERIVRGVHGPLAQGYHAAIGALAGAGVDGGENGHAHAGGLLGSISLRASHLAHGDDVGIEAKGDVQ